jgi:hypothetical protein
MPGERALTASRLSGARMTDPRAPAHRPRQGTAAQIDGDVWPLELEDQQHRRVCARYGRNDVAMVFVYEFSKTWGRMSSSMIRVAMSPPLSLRGTGPFDQSRSRPSGESVSDIDNPRGLSDSPSGWLGIGGPFPRLVPTRRPVWSAHEAAAARLRRRGAGAGLPRGAWRRASWRAQRSCRRSVSIFCRPTGSYCVPTSGLPRPSAGPKIFNSWPLMGLMCSSPASSGCVCLCPVLMMNHQPCSGTLRTLPRLRLPR